MDYDFEPFIEREKRRILQTYDCQTIEEALALLEKRLRESQKKQ